MGVFDDKKFDNLDWISQTTEPIDSHLNDLLSKLPDEFIIDFATYKDVVGENYYLDISIEKVVSYFIAKLTNINITWQERGLLADCFEFSLGEEVCLDFEQKVITGELKIVKVTTTMDERVLAKTLGKEGIDSLNYAGFRDDMVSRANEVMELLEKCENGLRTRSARNKKYAIIKRLHELFANNEWNIKDTALANKVGIWITDYIVNENLAAFSNFCRLKVMTHKNQPIYSMEEVQ